MLDVMIDGGVGYNGKDGEDRDLWSKVETMPEDAAYRSIREPMTITDVDGKKVKAQVAAFIGTIWKRVHRDIPKWLGQILSNQKKIIAKQDVIIGLVNKHGGLTAAEVDAIVDQSIKDNVPALVEGALENAVIDVNVEVNGKEAK